MGQISFIVRKGNRVCRHCRLRTANRPRGLCWSCYYTPGVREQYGVAEPILFPGNAKATDCTRRGAGLSQEARPLPEPTAMPPGEQRVAVLASRAEAGLELWHPEDKKPELE